MLTDTHEACDTSYDIKPFIFWSFQHFTRDVSRSECIHTTITIKFLVWTFTSWLRCESWKSWSLLLTLLEESCSAWSSWTESCARRHRRSCQRAFHPPHSRKGGHITALTIQLFIRTGRWAVLWWPCQKKEDSLCAATASDLEFRNE